MSEMSCHFMWGKDMLAMCFFLLQSISPCLSQKFGDTRLILHTETHTNGFQLPSCIRDLPVKTAHHVPAKHDAKAHDIIHPLQCIITVTTPLRQRPSKLTDTLFVFTQMQHTYL